MSFRTLAFLAATAMFSQVATAQCTPQLVANGVTSSINTTADAKLVLWDPDAAGPATSIVLMPGIADVVSGTGLLTWDTQTRRFARNLPVPAGVVAGVIVSPSNELFIHGDFTAVDNSRFSVARYSGTTWVPVGANLSGKATSIALSPTGQIFAVGATITGDSTSPNVTFWDGTTWTAIGTARTSSLTNANINRVVRLSSGDVVIGGSFTSVSGVTANRVARWDGTAWHAMSNGAVADVNDLDVDAAGTLYASGFFSLPTGLTGVASWNGSAWQSLGVPPSLNVSEGRLLAFAPDGDLVVTQEVTTGRRLYRRDGGVWGFMPGVFQTNSMLDVLVLPNGDTLVVGAFDTVNNLPVKRLALLRAGSSAWEQMAFGFDGVIRGLCALDGSNLLAWGDFKQTDDGLARYVARFDGQRWHDASAGFPNGPNDPAPRKIVRMANGQVVATYQERVGLTFRINLYTLNGVAWSRWSPDFTGTINDLAPLPNGDLIAVGNFGSVGSVFAERVARWNGVTWQAMGSGFNGPVFEVEVTQSGEVQVIGEFTGSGATPISNAARWTGSAWAQLGTNALPFEHDPGNVMKSNGEWHVTRAERLPNGSTRETNWWLNGSTWQPIPNDGVFSTPVLLPDDLVLYRQLGFTVPFRWNAGSYTAWGPEYQLQFADIWATTQTPDGRISLGGFFTGVDPRNSGRFVQLIPCPASCDSIDFNNNQVFPEDQDVIDFFTVLAGGTCPTCNDIDFNNNQVFPEDQDVVDFFTVLAGGPCP